MPVTTRSKSPKASGSRIHADRARPRSKDTPLPKVKTEPGSKAADSLSKAAVAPRKSRSKETPPLSSQSLKINLPREAKHGVAKTSTSTSPPAKTPLDQGLNRNKKAPNSPETLDNTITDRPCWTCDCPEGLFQRSSSFEVPTGICIRCHHHMDEHMDDSSHSWSRNTDYLSLRNNLVHGVLESVRTHGAFVIRATPEVGKTMLLILLGHHVLYNEHDLEPVYFEWTERRKRDENEKDVDKYLEAQKSRWQERNARFRKPHPKNKTLFLIDEAQGSYDEEDFWSKLFKNRTHTRSSSLFLLSCLYGIAGIGRDRHLISRASQVDSLQRIELRPSRPGSLHMLFNKPELEEAVEKWAQSGRIQVREDFSEYFLSVTDGHPGMVGLILQYLHRVTEKEFRESGKPRIWTSKRLHKKLGDTELTEHLQSCGRSLWSKKTQRFVQEALESPIFSAVRFSDIAKTLREVALCSQGYMPPANPSEALTFCHRQGLLYTERHPIEDRPIYTFASPIHRRVIFQSLFPGLLPDQHHKTRTLRDVCVSAIKRFSPSALLDRPTSPGHPRRAPEAAFQDELYCCLSHELSNLPVLSEYSHDESGRIDFYILQQKWGIEVLRHGNQSSVMEHAGRFRAGGKYSTWNILKDHIIINFCCDETLATIEVPEQDVASRIIHVVVNPEEWRAEIYNGKKELQEVLSLDEGRRGFGLEDFRSMKGTVFEDYPESLEAHVQRQKEMSREWALQMENEELRRENAVLKERQEGNAVKGGKRSRADGEKEGREGREGGKRSKRT